MKRFLLINLNNTYTKLALSDEEKLLKKTVIPTKKLTAVGVNRILQRWAFDFALVGSVVPQKTGIFRRSVKAPLLEVSPELAVGIGLDLPQPAAIGADRIANAVSVAQRHGMPAVVVDFGTAVTFDIISRKGHYIGGVIAPGLGVMTDYLYQKTPLLPKIDLEEPTAVIGKSTREAMLAGAVYGSRGLARQIGSEIVSKLSGKPHIVATGM